MGAICGSVACSKTNSQADTTGSKANTGQITDSIVPGGPNGAFTSTSSTPTTGAAAPAVSRASTQSATRKKATAGEQDSAIQPKFSIDDKGVVRPIKH
jgi:hypothetical protein